MSELQQFIYGIPYVTRLLTLASLATAGLCSLGIASFVTFIFYWPYITEKAQIWRFFTGFLVSNSQPMQGLMEIYMLYSYSRGLEEGKFLLNLPDYVYYYLIVLPLILLSALFTDAVALNSVLLSALTYTWSIANKNSQVSFYFLPIKASLLPAVSIGFRLLIDGKMAALQAIGGMLAAYIYNCLETRSLGPLSRLILQRQPNSSSGRVGTVHTLSSVESANQDDGYLPSPEWLRKLCSKLTGKNYMTHYPSVHAMNKSSDRRSEATTSSYSRYGDSSFKGKGQRLGT